MRWLLLLLALPLAPAKAVQAQLPLFVGGLAGGAFNTDDNLPGGSGGGFTFQTNIGLRLPRVAFGGEYGEHRTGGDFKTRVFGAFVRLPSAGNGPVRLYLTAGLGAYQVTPTSGASSTTAGGSLGPGADLTLIPRRLGFVVEARFHSTFDRLPRINRQQFIAILGGLELRL